MMVSYFQLNYRGFGSGIVVPNCVGPRKRPFNTINPGFATVGGAMDPADH
jgi:gamma-glutamyltranspeptidase / glutathione hydrolase